MILPNILAIILLISNQTTLARTLVGCELALRIIGASIKVTILASAPNEVTTTFGTNT